MKKKDFIAIGIFSLLFLLLLGCIEPKPLPPPPSTTATVYYSPIQCRGNPWEQWYDSGAVNYLKAPTEEELVKDYYSLVEKIEIIKVEVIPAPPGTTVCMACSCSNGDTIKATVEAKNREKMLSLGWLEQNPMHSLVGAVSVLTDKNEYSVGEKITVFIANDSNEGIFLPGCNEYTIGRQTDCLTESDCIGNDWEPVNQKECIWEGYALKIAGGETKTFEETVGESWGLGGLKVRVDYSVGCVEGEPLSQASCADSNAVYSDEFSIIRAISDNNALDVYQVTVTPS
ncbi:MAG: hypothetical protein V1494_05165 [Candidatus Diapherotrites archaeon]